jgi:hypothetical protein
VRSSPVELRSLGDPTRKLGSRQHSVRVNSAHDVPAQGKGWGVRESNARKSAALCSGVISTPGSAFVRAHSPEDALACHDAGTAEGATCNPVLFPSTSSELRKSACGGMSKSATTTTNNAQ